MLIVKYVEEVQLFKSLYWYVPQETQRSHVNLSITVFIFHIRAKIFRV